MKPTSPRVVVILSYLTYLLFGAFTATVGPVLGELAAQTSSALATIGGVVTLLFVGALVAQVIAGPITDQVGHKAVLVASLLILSARPWDGENGFRHSSSGGGETESCGRPAVPGGLFGA